MVKLFPLKANKEFSLSFLFSILSALLGFIFSFYCARTLEADRYGQVQYYLSISSLLTLFMAFGSDSFVLKNIQFQQDKKRWMTVIFAYVAICSLIVLPCYFLIAYFLLSKLDGNIVLIFTIYFVALVSTYVTIIASFLTGISKNEIRILLSGIIPHLLMIIIFFCHYFTKTLNLFVSNYLYYSFGISFFIVLPFFIKLTRFGGQKIGKKDFLTMLMFALTYISYTSITPIANILIGETYDTFGVTGIFSLSSQLLSIAGLVSGIIGSISTPTISKMLKNGQKDDLQKYYGMVTRISMYISLPIYIAFAVEAGRVLAFFGDSYTTEPLILTLLSISSMIETITGPTGTILLMGGKEKQHFLVALARLVINVAVLAVLLKFTVLAAPIAGIISISIANVIKLVLVNRFQGRNYFTKDVWLPLLIIGMVCIGLFFGLSFINNKAWWSVANGVCGLLVIFIFLFFTPYKNDRHFFVRGKEKVGVQKEDPGVMKASKQSDEEKRI